MVRRMQYVVSESMFRKSVTLHAFVGRLHVGSGIQL